MKIEVLCPTMHQKDISKYKEMNLQTDAVIANQADCCAYSEHKVNGHTVRFITTDTRGASVNRNIAIIYSTADIIVFADDDQQFVDGYEKLIIEEFAEHPDADAIKFYCKSTNPERQMSYKKPQEFCKATKIKIMSAGVHGFAIKKDFLIKNNILFDVNIGPGRSVYCGEDSVFLSDLCDSKAKIYLSPTFISYINQGESSWFKGYDSQYFISVGYIYSCIYKNLSLFAMLRQLIKFNDNRCNFSKRQMFCYMLEGRKKHRKQF